MDEGNHRKLVTVIEVLTEIQNGHLQNANEKDCLTQLAWYNFIPRCSCSQGTHYNMHVEHTLPFKYLENFTPCIFNNKFNCTVNSFNVDKVVTYIVHEIIFILAECHTHIFH